MPAPTPPLKSPKYIAALQRQVYKMSEQDAVAHVLRYISEWSVFSAADGTYYYPFHAAGDARANTRALYWNNLIERIYGEFDLPIGVWWDEAAQRVVHGPARHANVARPAHMRKRAGFVPAKRSVVCIDSKRARCGADDRIDAGTKRLIDAILERKAVSSEGGVKVGSEVHEGCATVEMAGPEIESGGSALAKTADLALESDGSVTAKTGEPELEFEGGFSPALEASSVPFVSA
jgi:predicted small secreted protein